LNLFLGKLVAKNIFFFISDDEDDEGTGVAVKFSLMCLNLGKTN
jgi:hypothetical protein